MRGQRATGIGLGVMVVVGATTTASGAFADGDGIFRGGIVLLLMGLAGLITHRSHCNTTRLIEHQTKLAVMTMEQRQAWAERGYRAGQMDALASPVHAVDDDSDACHVLPLPVPRAPWQHRSGA